MSLWLSNCVEIYWEPLSVLVTSFKQSGFFEAKVLVSAAMTPSVTALVSNVYTTHSRVNASSTLSR